MAVVTSNQLALAAMCWLIGLHRPIDQLCSLSTSLLVSSHPSSGYFVFARFLQSLDDSRICSRTAATVPSWPVCLFKTRSILDLTTGAGDGRRRRSGPSFSTSRRCLCLSRTALASRSEMKNNSKTTTTIHVVVLAPKSVELGQIKSRPDGKIE